MTFPKHLAINTLVSFLDVINDPINNLHEASSACGCFNIMNCDLCDYIQVYILHKTTNSYMKSHPDKCPHLHQYLLSPD